MMKLKKWICFSQLVENKTCYSKTVLLLHFALPANGLRYWALGRAWILFGSRENSKPENYRKKPQNPQRPVHALLVRPTFGRRAAQKPEPCLNWLDFTRATIFYKPDFAMGTETELKERQSRELAQTFAKNWLCQKVTLPEKMNLAKKPEPNLPKLLLKKSSQFRKPDLVKKNTSQKKWTLQNETVCLQKLWPKTVSQFWNQPRFENNRR